MLLDMCLRKTWVYLYQVWSFDFAYQYWISIIWTRLWWAPERWWILLKQRAFGFINAVCCLPSKIWLQIPIGCMVQQKEGLELWIYRQLVNYPLVIIFCSCHFWQLVNYGPLLLIGYIFLLVLSYVSYIIFHRKSDSCLGMILLLKWVVLIDRHGFAFLKEFCKKYCHWTV